MLHLYTEQNATGGNFIVTDPYDSPGLVIQFYYTTGAIFYYTVILF